LVFVYAQKKSIEWAKRKKVFAAAAAATIL
jgi:hypothetical protein